MHATNRRHLTPRTVAVTCRRSWFRPAAHRRRSPPPPPAHRPAPDGVPTSWSRALLRWEPLSDWLPHLLPPLLLPQLSMIDKRPPQTEAAATAAVILLLSDSLAAVDAPPPSTPPTDASGCDIISFTLSNRCSWLPGVHKRKNK